LLADGAVLVVGGNRAAGGLLASGELYDPTSGTWRDTPNMAAARVGHSATLLPDGTVLVAGGSDAAPASAELYDPDGGS